MERGCMPAIDDNHPGGHPGDELLGFMATSNLDEPWAFIEQIEGIDLTEWHTYTILWEPEAATFLIDNLVVAEIDEAPHMPMGIYLSWWTGLNLTPPCRKVGQEEACTDEYVQIDYIRVFTHTEWQEELSQKMLALFSQVDARMSEAEDGGKDVSRLRDDYTSLEEIWEKESYSSYGRIKEALEGILTVLEAWDEVVEMFYQANATIQEAEQLGADARPITIMKGYYSQAEIKWKEQDIESTEIYLQKILDMPEPLSLYLISLLGLISLPVFRQRWFRDVVRLDTEEGLGKPLPGLHFCILRCFYKEALSDQPRVSGGAQRGSEKEE
jgi:hypothetical protein